MDQPLFQYLKYKYTLQNKNYVINCIYHKNWSSTKKKEVKSRKFMIFSILSREI